MRQEKQYYSEILEDIVAGLEAFAAEDFIPCKGTILIVKPPPLKKIGNVILPDRSHKDQLIARVAAVPILKWARDETGTEISYPDEECPVRPGDWVVYREQSDVPVPFGNRTDLALLNYGGGVESDIRGFLPRDVVLKSPEEVLTLMGISAKV